MRNKVVVIKGWANICREVTLGEYERVNADHVVTICALRRPQFFPSHIKLDLATIELNVKAILAYWKEIGQDHHLASEYATVVNDRGGETVKVVEGEALREPWFFETVRAMHKFFGQTVVEGEVICGREEGIVVRLGEQEMPRREAIERLRPLPFLG